MTRIVAIVVALVVAAPAVVGAEALMLHGIEFAGPDDCCCPDRGDETPVRPEIEPACCCEVHPIHQSVVVTSAAVFERDESSHLSGPPPGFRTLKAGEARSMPSPVNGARGPPPPRSLFALRTSLLL